jgi:hypothetical protein
MNVLFFPFVGPLDNAGEGDGGCTGKLGCPGKQKKDARKLSVSESNAQTDISLDYLEGLVEVHGDFAF